MALPVMHTLSQNISIDAIKAGKYNNIRLKGIAGNMYVALSLNLSLTELFLSPPFPTLFSCSFLETPCPTSKLK